MMLGTSLSVMAAIHSMPPPLVSIEMATAAKCSAVTIITTAKAQTYSARGPNSRRRAVITMIGTNAATDYAIP